MGAKKSKCNLCSTNSNDQLQHQIDNHKKLTLQKCKNNELNTSDTTKNNNLNNNYEKNFLDEKIFLDEKLNYEESYRQLDMEHTKLETDFLQLKSKLIIDDNMSRGDFTAYTNDLSNKINEIMHEHDTMSPMKNYYTDDDFDQEKQQIDIELKHNYEHSEQEDKEEEDIEQQKQQQFNEMFENNNEISFNNILPGKDDYVDEQEENEKELRKQLEMIQISFRDEIENLKKDQDRLLSDNECKDKEIRNLQLEIEQLQVKCKSEIIKLREEFNKKCLLLCERQEAEKIQINSTWESKVLEVMNSCNKDVAEFKGKINQEKDQLQQKLKKANEELNSLSMRNKQLSGLFYEIQKRYKARESRKEDLEKIAELEGELIIQSENIQKQKYIIKQLKSSGNSSGNNITKNNLNNGNHHNNNNNNNNGRNGNGNGKRCRKSNKNQQKCYESKAKILVA